MSDELVPLADSGDGFVCCGCGNGPDYVPSLEARIEALEAENAELKAKIATCARDLAMTELANEDARADWLDGFRHAVSRIDAVLTR